MKVCKTCFHGDWARSVPMRFSYDDVCKACVYLDCELTRASNWKPMPQTNADRIRAMSDEELGVFLCGIAATNCCGGCMVQEYCYAEHNGFADWLRQPVKDGDNDG